MPKEESDLSYVTIADLARVEETLSEAAFLDGITINGTGAPSIETMNACLTSTPRKVFHGIRIDTCYHKR